MRLSNPPLLILVFLLLVAATATTTTTTTTEKICLDLTSMVEGASIEVLRLVVKEKGGATEEDYVIDLTKKKVFPDKHESANSLEVSQSESEEKFEVESMPCGGSITKRCGIIELPQTYGPGLDCTWTFNTDEPLVYKFDTFDMPGRGDELFIKNEKTTSKPEEDQLSKGDTINFKSGDLSDGKTKFKITFKKVGDEDPQVDPNSCKPFYFEWDEGTVASETNRKIPRRMMDDIGPTMDDSGKKVPRIFRYAGENRIPGTIGKPSAYSNEGLIIQQKKARSTPFNYFVIGQQAWQWFDTKKDPKKTIKADTCPYAFPEWNFKGKKYTNMKAVEATAEQLEADGACEPQQLFAVDPQTGGTTSTK